ncbi:hypothetical protein R6Q57_011693 [Mikania cordata]
MATVGENVKPATPVTPTSVPVRVAHELHQAGHRYLDVRTPEEFAAGHAVGAINVPYLFKLGSVTYRETAKRVYANMTYVVNQVQQPTSPIKRSNGRAGVETGSKTIGLVEAHDT